MSREIKLFKDYYDNGDKLFDKRSITFEPGLTVLVGCNGYGKTTLLQIIKDQLEDNEIDYSRYNNLRDGGSRATQKYGFYGQTELMVAGLVRSEGEFIYTNICQLAQKIGQGIRKARRDNKKEYWVLLDAIDSGLSIDNILDIKANLFDVILEDCKNTMDAYIIVSANSFEIARNERCLDVRRCKFKTFKSYNAYRNFVIKSFDRKTKYLK